MRTRKVLRLRFNTDRFDLGVELEDFAAHFTAPAGLLVSSKRQSRIKDVVAVNPDPIVLPIQADPFHIEGRDLRKPLYSSRSRLHH